MEGLVPTKVNSKGGIPLKIEVVNSDNPPDFFMKKGKFRRSRARRRSNRFPDPKLGLQRDQKYIIITKWNDRLGKSKEMNSFDAWLTYKRLIFRKQFALILRVGSPYHHSFVESQKLINLRF